MNCLKSFHFLLITALLFCSVPSYAIEETGIYEGVFLEFPQGRFQENEAPKFFKWNIRTRTASISLKVFRCENACTIQSRKELVSRFDFLSDVQTMNWFGEALPVGHYIWSVEGFSKDNPNPIFSDTAIFSIEAIKTYGFKTRRIGLLAGFGRGNYTSGDANYEVDFRITPTIYGLSYGGGSATKIWNVKGYFSDFILKGDLYKTATVSGDYLWQLNVSDPGRVLYFLGPTLKYFNYPRAISTNGVDLDIKNESLFSPGVAFKGQYDFDKYVAFQFGIQYDVAAAGTAKIDTQIDNGSVNASVGLTYGKIWPVGVGGEIQYQRDKIGTKPDANGSLVVEQDQWVILLHLFYAI